MRPASIPQTPTGRWVAHIDQGHCLDTHHEHDHEAAIQGAIELDLLDGDFIGVGKIKSNEDLLDGDLFATAILDRLRESVADRMPNWEGEWPKYAGPKLKGGRDAPREALGVMIRGGVMRYLVETGDFPPPWTASQDVTFKVELVSEDHLREIYKAKNIRGRDPTKDVFELPGSGAFAVRRVLGEGPNDISGSSFFSPALHEFLDGIIVSQAQEFEEKKSKAQGPKPTKKTCRANGCEAKANATREVEDHIGETVELDLCPGHTLRLDRGDPVEWNADPIERKVGGEA